jgi:PKD repeat protein
MNKQKEVWSANIPGQNEGVTVRFFVKAFDKKGNSAASSILDYTVVMSNNAPVADFTESAEIMYVDDAINFNAASSHDPDGTIVSYHWDFGDGTTGTGVSVSHSYTESGTYVVTLTVTDDDGATDTVNAAKGVLIRTVQPQNQGPSAYFSESAETVYTGENIFFDASDSSDPDGTIISYLWNFGDGNTAVGVETTHAYGDDGTSTVTLTIIDNDGATDSTTFTKIVLNRPPTALFTENATTVKTGETIQFDASHSSDPDGIIGIVEYFWDFGDETNATGVTPTHAYSENGSYTVTLTVTDDDGASSSESALKFVKTEEELDSALFLSFTGAVALGLMAFTVTLLYGLLIRRRRRRRT